MRNIDLTPLIWDWLNLGSDPAGVGPMLRGPVFLALSRAWSDGGEVSFLALTASAAEGGRRVRGHSQQRNVHSLREM